RLAVRAGLPDPIDHHGDADALDRRLVQRGGAHRPPDLEVGRLLLLAVLRAVLRRDGVGVRQVVLHADAAFLFRRLVARRHALLAARHLVVRVVALLRLVDVLEVHLDRRLGAHMAGADGALEHVLHRAAEALFGLAAQPLRRLDRRGRAGRLAGPGEHAAAAVDDGDVLRLQAGNRGGDEVEDRLHAFAVQPRGPRHRQHHARLRRLPLARERLPPRHDEVDAGPAHAVPRADGARQLALQRPGLVDLLLELRRGERVGVVEDLVADAAAGRQAV